MKYLLLVSLCLMCAHALNTKDIQWQLWKFKFSKTYSTLEEETDKKEIWTSNLDLVEHHNNKSGVTYKMGLNRFSDQLPMRRPTYLTIPRVLNSVESTKLHQRAPAQFDWRKKGVVFPVRNQGEIGDPVALGTADAVASFHAINFGQLYNLSTHQYADCCGGFLLGDVFKCVHHINGLCIADEYKVTNCKDPECDQVGKVDGGVAVTSGDETALQMAVLIAPVLVGIDAHLASFQMYVSGIYSDPGCSSKQLDHAVLLVGYGTDSSGNDYWICKNSWGVNWGMKGYINIARNKGNMCGIATDAQYPV